MYCPDCGSRNRLGARFCIYCGTGIQPPDPEARAAILELENNQLQHQVEVLEADTEQLRHKQDVLRYRAQMDDMQQRYGVLFNRKTVARHAMQLDTDDLEQAFRSLIGHSVIIALTAGGLDGLSLPSGIFSNEDSFTANERFRRLLTIFGTVEPGTPKESVEQRLKTAQTAHTVVQDLYGAAIRAILSDLTPDSPEWKERVGAIRQIVWQRLEERGFHPLLPEAIPDLEVAVACSAIHVILELIIAGTESRLANDGSRTGDLLPET